MRLILNDASLSSGTQTDGGPLRTGMKALVALTLIALSSTFVAAGCGGKPQFCEDRTTLQESVKSLPSAATSGGVSGLEDQVSKVEADAKTVIDSAKDDFPTETAAIESALNQLKTSVNDLPEKPSTSQLAGLAINASAVVSSVNAFVTATDEECK